MDITLNANYICHIHLNISIKVYNVYARSVMGTVTVTVTVNMCAHCGTVDWQLQ